MLGVVFSDHWWEQVVRGLSIGILVISIGLLGRHAWHRWTNYTDKSRDYWWSLLGWSVLGVVAATEDLLHDSGSDSRTVLRLLVAGVTLHGLVTQGNLEQEHLHVDDSDDPE